MSSSFPDQVHVDRIREALWSRLSYGNAAVLVGAGMSRNAKPAVLGQGTFPDWTELAQRIVDSLYPEHEAVYNEQRERALQQIKATSGILRFSQEFEAAFGRTALDRLIIDSIPDERFEPGELHEILLDLPWSDVFTTNWDTLLERGTRKLLDRRYDVVRTIPEIPRSMKPRIVKLHGSLPANAPFILTEEDFRTYPVKFAPFVNMVQQSMMENVFCLVGFSGDDPNFLYWSGWVRDHLGPSAPKIYLVGWLGLSSPRRRMLEDRGVVPVDLSALPGAAEWPSSSRHRMTLEWFLWSLRLGEPYREADWPHVRQPPRKPKGQAHLQGIATSSRPEPKQEHFSPPPDPKPNEKPLEQLRSEIKIWKHNRSLYPGWVIAPPVARQEIWFHTQRWIPFTLECLKDAPATERLTILRELNWRLEICLVPLSKEIAAELDCVLNEVDPGTESWIELAVARLRYARESDAPAEFDPWENRLRTYCHEFPWLESRIRYERCLYALSSLDHSTIEKTLVTWIVWDEDPFWGIRKASLLAEIGKTEDAYQTSLNALAAIRQRSRKDVLDLASLSREGWAIVLRSGFEVYEYSLKKKAAEDAGEPKEEIQIETSWEASRARLERLSAYKCDPRASLNELSRTLENEVPLPRPREEEKREFDPGLRTIQLHIGTENLENRLLPAYQFKRLVEEVGFPPVVNMTDMAKTSLLRAATWLADSTPNVALGILLRTSRHARDEVLNSFFSRTRLALLAPEDVENLVLRIEASLDHAVPAAEQSSAADDRGRFMYWLGRVELGVELLSRLVLRLDMDRVEKIVQQALGYCRSSLFERRPELDRPLDHLLARSLEVLPPLRIQKLLLDFVSLRVPEMDGFEPADSKRWPEPLKEIDVKPGQFVRPEGSPQWDQAIERLIRAVGVEGSYPRSRATLRLYLLHQWRLLTDTEQQAFARAFWINHRSRGGWPGDVEELLPAAFLKLPEPEPGLAERAFREAYLGKGKVHVETRFLDNLVSAVLDGLVLSSQDIDSIFTELLAWWKDGGPAATTQPRSFWGFPDPRDIQGPVVKLLSWILLPSLPIDDDRIGSVVDLVEDLRSSGFPVELIYPPLLRLRPDLRANLSLRLRRSLAALEKQPARAAIGAVWNWLREGESWGIDPPADDLSREIGIAISVRRPSNLQTALQAAEWMLATKSPAVTAEFARFVSEGLGYLLEEARYERAPEAEKIPGFPDIPELRAQCVRTAQALEHAGYGSEPPVADWLAVKTSDPLPEVRLARSQWIDNEGAGQA